jgi:hypothetical protein
VPPLHITKLYDAVPARPADSYLLHPNLGYVHQLQALMWGHVASRPDLHLSNKLRIWVDGYRGEFNIPEAQQIRFHNPESGLTYIARTYGPDQIDGKTVDKGIGSRMLAKANLLLAASYEVQRDANGAPILNQFGLPELVLDASGNPVEIPSGRLLEYQRYVGLVDAAVQIGNLVGYGPFNAE